LASAIHASPVLALSATQIGLAASAYIVGAVAGALIFGRLADHHGRRKLFVVTVCVYATATILSGFAWNFWSFAFFRMMTGAGIGGEYAAINSAIQEFVPARWRGRVDLAVNGSYWVGAALAAAVALVVLDPNLFAPDRGWRVAFIIGGVLALIVVYVRRFVPESPRWLMTHGHPKEAERIVDDIEQTIVARRGPLPVTNLPAIRLHARGMFGVRELLHTLFVRHRDRAILGLVLMATQAFCYNAVFFTYSLILTRFYAVAPENVGWFILPFAAGNFLGPVLLGGLFDTVGRKPMISATYAISGLLLCVTGAMFAAGMLTALTQTIAWSVIFFFASAGASAAYLTVGECFPLETRASSIAVFYAIGTAAGGIIGPAMFGALIDTGAPAQILWGYVLGGALMLAAAAVELKLGVAAERCALEDVATPLSAADQGN
jgi:MFS family permease